MTPERFKEIKARCEAEDYTNGRKLTLGGLELDMMYKQLRHAREDLPDCLEEIERLQELVKRPTNNCDCGNTIDHDYCTRCLRQWES